MTNNKDLLTYEVVFAADKLITRWSKLKKQENDDNCDFPFDEALNHLKEGVRLIKLNYR